MTGKRLTQENEFLRNALKQLRYKFYMRPDRVDDYKFCVNALSIADGMRDITKLETDLFPQHAVLSEDQKVLSSGDLEKMVLKNQANFGYEPTFADLYGKSLKATDEASERKVGASPVLGAPYGSGTNGDTPQNLELEAGAKMAERLALVCTNMTDQSDYQEAAISKRLARLCHDFAAAERAKKTLVVPG